MRRHAKAVTAATAALLLTLALSATLASAVAPVVSVEDASNPSYTTADVKGTVNPEGQSTTWRFQYIADALFQENLSNSLPGFEGASTGPEEGTETEETLERQLSGLNPGTTYHLRLVAENGDGQSEAVATNTFTTEAVGPPSVSIDPVTIFDGTTAKFSGSIDPEAPVNDPAFEVTWHFECTPQCPSVENLHNEDHNKYTTPTDSDPHEVEVDAPGLEPNTSYEVTLVGENAGGSVSDGPEGFKTEGVAPEVQTLYAGSVDTDSAILAANINPKNSPTTTYQFEWGTGGSYGNVAPGTPQALGAEDNAFHIVTAPISGLSKGTTYRFRVVATNSETSEVRKGMDHGLTTRSTPTSIKSGLSNGRFYEKVSPSEKEGADIRRGSGLAITPLSSLAQAASSGQAVAYASAGNFGGDGGPPFVQYIARRGASGWASDGVSPRMDSGIGTTGSVNFYRWYSDDLSKGIVAIRARLHPQDPKDVPNLYLRNMEDGSHRLLNVSDPPMPPFSLSGYFYPTDVSKDAKHILFSAAGDPGYPLTPDSPPNGGIYEWVDGKVNNVAILPDGTSATLIGPGFGGGNYSGLSSAKMEHAGDNIISDDGSRIFFSAMTDFAQPKALYVREDAQHTSLISGSERSGDDPDAPEEGEFLGASSDGSVVFFTSSAPLTDDATSVNADLYKWDAAADPGDRLTDLTTGDPGNSVLGSAWINDDGTSLYFVATGQLAPGAQKEAPNLYLWQRGEGIHHIATLSFEDSAVWGRSLFGKYGVDPANDSYNYGGARASATGRYLAFSSHQSLTSYDTAGLRQIYLYDSVGDQAVCVSCSPHEPKSRDESWFASVTSEDSCCDATPQLPRNLSQDGSRVFFDSRASLVPRDTNGVTDVYEWTNGNLSLVSNGENRAPSRFLDAGANGDDVFFTSAAQLTPSDEDQLVDLYDARVGGVREPEVRVPCVADECQGTPSPAPPFPTPSSSSSHGPGDQVQRKRKQRQKKQRNRRHRHHSKHANRHSAKTHRETSR